MSVLGLDVGTSTCKGVVISAGGTLLAQHQISYAQAVTLQDGAAEIPASCFWDSAVQVIRTLAQAVDRSDPVAALAVSSHGETLIPVDHRGDVLGGAILSMDRRCSREAEALDALVGRERIYSITGSMMHPQFPIPKIMWLQRSRPEQAARTAHYYSTLDYIYARLGFPHVVDLSIGSRFGGLDIRQRRWSQEILSAAEVKESLLSEPVAGGTPLGFLPAEVARLLGLGDRVLAVAGGHDQPCAAIGMGAEDESVLTVSAGSYECAARATDAPLNNAAGMRYGLNSYCHVLPDKYITLAFFVSGMMAQWYLDTFCGEEKGLAAQAGRSVYDWMDEHGTPQPTGICVTPHIFGAMNPEWSEKATAKITGLTAGATKADLYRAVLEGTCCELDLNLRVLEKLTGPAKSLRMTGGGTRSRRWMELRAEITGKEIEVLEHGAEASCVGAAILAGMGLGIFTGPEDANRRLQRSVRRYTPRNPEQYAGQKAAYLTLHRPGLMD